MHKPKFNGYKIRDLRTLHTRYCKVTGSKSKLKFYAKADKTHESGWSLDYVRYTHPVFLGAHVAQAYPVLEEMLVEYNASTDKGEW